MKKSFLKILPLILFFLMGLFGSIVYGQNSDNEQIENIFSHFESGIKTGAVKEFSDYLYTETYISLETGVAGYFSANQSFYILKDFLSHYKPINFKIIKISTNNEKHYAIGKLVYNRSGVKGESQVFVSLKLESKKWKIYQITIN
ncbi:MAG: DUF4783 domain-containing protein [Melioribacteraceae bacterium]|nr:DUF4783 domain-containing protein [Melioribacteraceae bacterium]